MSAGKLCLPLSDHLKRYLLQSRLHFTNILSPGLPPLQFRSILRHDMKKTSKESVTNLLLYKKQKSRLSNEDILKEKA